MTRRRWLPVLAFVVLSFALAWLVVLPIWLRRGSGPAGIRGLGDPLLTVAAVAMMATPAVAAVVVTSVFERGEGTRLGVRLGLRTPARMPWRQTILGSGIGIGLLLALCLLALPVGWIFGVYDPDLADYSALRAIVADQLAAVGQDLGTLGGIPIWALAWLQVAAVVPGALINAVPALGEEIGWRGWLLPRLLPLGRVWAIVISGVIWGLWHAPLLLLGYNYPMAPRWQGVLMMIGMTILIGGILGWLRLRTGTVYAAAIGHGAVNAAAGSYVLFANADAVIDTRQVSVLGWTGWILPAVVLTFLLVKGRWQPSKAG